MPSPSHHRHRPGPSGGLLESSVMSRVYVRADRARGLSEHPGRGRLSVHSRHDGPAVEQIRGQGSRGARSRIGWRQSLAERCRRPAKARATGSGSTCRRWRLPASARCIVCALALIIDAHFFAFGKCEGSSSPVAKHCPGMQCPGKRQRNTRERRATGKDCRPLAGHPPDEAGTPSRPDPARGAAGRKARRCATGLI
jgi:hypothetical protein